MKNMVKVGNVVMYVKCSNVVKLHYIYFIYYICIICNM